MSSYLGPVNIRHSADDAAMFSHRVGIRAPCCLRYWQWEQDRNRCGIHVRLLTKFMIYAYIRSPEATDDDQGSPILHRVEKTINCIRDFSSAN